VQPRVPQDFVGVGVADAGDELAARQHALDFSTKKIRLK
jgi:hypothetical protein